MECAYSRGESLQDVGRWFAIALIVNSLVIAFSTASRTAIDSWGVVPGTAWVFLFLGLIAGFFVLPAAALWPRTSRQRPRAVFSVLLVSLWLLAIHTVGIVGTVWHRWGICLPPGYQFEYVDGPESSPAQCEVGPS